MIGEDITSKSSRVNYFVVEDRRIQINPFGYGKGRC